MNYDTELLNVYIWSDELKDGRPLHDVIVDRVKELNDYALSAVRVYSSPTGCGPSGGLQTVVKVLARTKMIDQVQRFVRKVNSSGWMTREKGKDFCDL